MERLKAALLSHGVSAVDELSPSPLETTVRLSRWVHRSWRSFHSSINSRYEA